MLENESAHGASDYSISNHRLLAKMFIIMQMLAEIWESIFNLGLCYCLDQGFLTWGTCTPRGTFAYPKGYI